MPAALEVDKAEPKESEEAKLEQSEVTKVVPEEAASIEKPEEV